MYDMHTVWGQRKFTGEYVKLIYSQFIIILFFFNYYVIFHVEDSKPTLPYPVFICIRSTSTKNISRKYYVYFCFQMSFIF